MLELFDNHAHYDDEKFNEDRDEVIRKVHESGVTKFISAGYSCLLYTSPSPRDFL